MHIVRSIRDTCPADTLEIKDGKVAKYSKWVQWNGRPWNTIVVERVSNGFRCDISDPNGGGTFRGDLKTIAKRFDSAIGERIVALFELDEPHGEELRALGFPG